MNWRPFTLPATLPVTRIFSHYPTRTLTEVKKPYPSQPDSGTHCTLISENRSDKNHSGEKAITAQWTKDTSHLVTLRIDLKKFYFSAMQFCCNWMTLTLTFIYRWFVILILIFHSDKESLDTQNLFCLLPNDDKPTVMVNTGVKDLRHSFSDEFCGSSLGTSIDQFCLHHWTF